MKAYSGPESVRQHVNRFAIATLLTGVGLLALAWPAQAKIVYTKVNVQIPSNSSYNLDLNNDGVTDFTITTAYSYSKCQGPGGGGFKMYFSVGETPASGNGAEGSPPARLMNGDLIGPSQTFYGGTGSMAYLYKQYCQGNEIRSGNWPGQHGDLGLSFQINGETHYGWAHLIVTNGSSTAATLTGYAYESIANMPIDAGKSNGADDDSAFSPGAVNQDDSDLVASVTTPTQAVSLGTLALGVQEVPLWRSKDSAGVAPENS